MKNYKRPIGMLVVIASILFTINTVSLAYAEEPVIEEPVVTESRIVEMEYIPAPPREPEYSLTEEEINLIATITMAEVENQSEYCQRLVIDTILNRVDSKYFPDTVHKVIYAKNQFECTVNGRADRCYPKEELVELVKEELLNRTNNQVVFFNSIGFNNWSKPLFQEGAVYFSACQYDE